MEQFQFVKDYKHDDALRTSFCRLASETFDIDFTEWYERGYWNERYIPFSYAWEGRIIANVSVSLLELVVDGVNRKAIQIGTVMTHPEFRKRGLSASLMEKVLTEYKGQYETMYLFANETVLDFYPKFGFQPVEERLFSMAVAPGLNGQSSGGEPLRPEGIRRLDMGKPEDAEMLQQWASERVPVSRRFGTAMAGGVLMFYALTAFREDIYYLQDEQVIAIWQKDGAHMELFDVISRSEVDLTDLVAKLAGQDTERTTFHFTPDLPEALLTEAPLNDGLFVKTEGIGLYPAGVKHPATSTA